MSTTASTTVAIAGTFVKAAGTTSTVGETANAFSMPSTNRIKYTGTPDRSVKIHASLSVQLDSAIVDKNLAISIYKNGSLITGSEIHGFAGATTAKPINLSSHVIISMSTNDFLEMYVSNIDSTDNITVTKMLFMAEAGVK